MIRVPMIILFVYVILQIVITIGPESVQILQLVYMVSGMNGIFKIVQIQAEECL